MKLIFSEIYKIWTNKVFLMLVSALLALNLFLIWTSTDTVSAIPPEAYKKMTVSLQGLSFSEKKDKIDKAYDQIAGIVVIDNIKQEEAISSGEYAEALKRDNKEILDKYLSIYEQGAYLNYTDSLPAEYTFLNQIHWEAETISKYPDYLREIHHQVEMFSDISIFQSANGNDFSEQSIKMTDRAYQNMDESLVDDYAPQKGLMTALSFQMTDICLILFMLMTAAVLINDEREKGMLKIIHTAPGGHLKTAASKITAMLISVFIMVTLLYASNLIYCSQAFGLGNLFRNIQSVPDLMQSTLRLNIAGYLLCYIFTKWAGAAVIGLWVLFSTMLCQKIYTGWCLSIGFIGLNFAAYSFFSPLRHYNILKYANLAGLLETHSLLGKYQLLYFFGRPVTRIFASAVVFAALMIIFLLLFLKGFTKGIAFRQSRFRWPLSFSLKCLQAKKNSKSGTRPHKSKRITFFEAYKLLFINGAVWLIILFIAACIYQGFSSTEYSNAEQIYYKKYMTQLTGSLTQEKVEWLQEEYKKFKPVLTVEAARNDGKIDDDTYRELMEAYSSLEFEKAIVDDIIYYKINYLSENPGAQLVYERGFDKLFSFSDNRELKELLTFFLFLSVSFCAAFSMEETGGMARILSTTPLGRTATVKIKLRLCIIIASAFALASLLPVYIELIRYKELTGIWCAAKSMEAFKGMPSWIPLAVVMFFQYLLRQLVCIWAVALICWLSFKIRNTLMSLFSSCFILCIPIMLALGGLEKMIWFSPYPVFHFIGMAGGGGRVSIGLVYMLALFGTSCFWIHDVFNKFGRA